VPVVYLAAARLAFITMKLFRTGAHTLRDRRKHLQDVEHWKTIKTQEPFAQRVVPHFAAAGGFLAGRVAAVVSVAEPGAPR
jgi:hypothetical protein